SAQSASPAVADDRGTPPSAAGSAGAAGDARPRRPRSLRGTRVDGGLATDASGRFVPTRDARRLFDYFFAASGEETDDRIAARIRAEIARRLPPDAARDANALLDRYLAYRARARELAASGVADADLASRLATLKALRRETLGDQAAQAFFAEEEAADELAIERRRVAEDATLSPEERARRLAEIEQRAAAAGVGLPSEATRALDLRDAEQRVRTQGGTREDVQALRERLVGPEAAARLATLDERRDEWRRRVDAYRAALKAVAQDPTLDDAGKRAAMARILDESFAGPDRTRAETLAPTPRPAR